MRGNLSTLDYFHGHTKLYLRYMPSGVLRAKQVEHLRLADPLACRPFLRKTADLFELCPTLPLSCVRRVWFDGYYDAKESALIFAILRRCKKLEDVFLPWTALRHGTVADWSNLFGSEATGSSINSLQIQVMDFPKGSSPTKKENHFDNEALESVSVDFTRLVRLRFFGKSSFMTITDKDLIAIARTAKNLRELYMSNGACLGVSAKGFGALIRSSQSSLEVLDLEGLSNIEPSEAEHHKDYRHIGLSQLVAQCPLLRILKLGSIRTCRDILSHEKIAWRGKVQICSQAPQSDEDTEILFQILDQARGLMASRKRPDEEAVDIEILTATFVFEPRCSLVHGDYQRAHHFRLPWVAEKKESHKKVQMIGYVRAFPYCITEDEFKDGFNKGYVWL